MEPTADDRWALVKTVIEMTATIGPEDASMEAAALIREAGIVARQHTGQPPEWFTSKTMAEWLLGSFLDIVDTESWFAMDPWLSVASQRLARAESQ
jgi:hypothetical protein